MPLSTTENLINLSQAAKALEVSTKTLRRLVAKKAVSPKRNQTGKIFFTTSDIVFIKEILGRAFRDDSLSVKQAASLLKVSADTLRRWEEEGLVKSERTSGGHRRYTRKQVYGIKSLGFKGSVIKRGIKIPVQVPVKVDGSSLFINEIPTLYTALHIDQKRILLTIFLFLASFSFLVGSINFAPKSLRNKVLGLVTHTTNYQLPATTSSGPSVLAGRAGVTTFNVNVETSFESDVRINGNLITDSASFDLINTNATTLNIGGAGTAVGIGATTGTTTINNNLQVNGTLSVGSASTSLNGVSYTFPSSQGTASTYLKNDGAGALTWASISTAADLTNVTGVLGVASGGTGASSAFTAGSVLFSNGTAFAQDNTNFFWDDTNNILKIGSGGKLTPTVNIGADLGSSALKWNNLYVANINSDSALTLSGQGIFTYDPADTTFAEASIRINPTAPSTNEQMLGIGQGGEERAAVDAEGDLTVGYDGTAGSSVPASGNPFNVYNHGTTNITSIDTTGNLSIAGVLAGTSGTNTRIQATGTGTGSTGTGSIYFLDSTGATKGRFDTTFSFSATGGTITTSGGYTTHTFLSTGTFTPSVSGNVEVLAVAGGGGGGGNVGGGGGGGEMLTGTIAVIPSVYTVTVGAGGAGGASAASGSNGSNSVFSSITALGGGGGGSFNTGSGLSGGSGGGAGGSGGSGGSATGTGKAGGNGGNGVENQTTGGGGGGQSVAGSAGRTTGTGNGGDGASSSFSGSSVTYAGGGGGGDYGTSTRGTGGAGGGGNGGDSTTGTAGTANTGGGGGGGGNNFAGGNGGSGIVIIRYYSYGALYAGSTNSAAADLAEYYVAGDNTIEAGDVISVSNIKVLNDNNQEITNKGVMRKATIPYDSKLLGIISTNPGVVLGSMDGATGKKDQRMLALSGRVPVKIDPESEPILIGDFLTSSDKPGLAKKATKAGYTVGKALEAWSCKPSTDYSLQTTASDSAQAVDSSPSTVSGSCSPTIEAFVNLGYYMGSLTTDGYIDTQSSFVANDIRIKLPGASPAPVLSASDSAVASDSTFPNLQYTNPDSLVSLAETISSILGKLDTVEGDISLLKTASISSSLSLSNSLTSLTVLGNTLLSDTVINGKLNVGVLSFDGQKGSLDAIGPLNLQPLSLDVIKFQGGKIEMDVSGNLLVKTGVISGNDKIRGQVLIPAGQTKIDVRQNWEIAPKSVVVSPSYVTAISVKNMSKEGFSVEVEKAPGPDESFYWIAFW